MTIKVKKAKKPAGKAAGKQSVKRIAAKAGGVDLLKVAAKVRVPDAVPGQVREADPAAALMDRTVPDLEAEDKVGGKLVIEVVHVNDKGERIEPSEKDKELDRRITGS